MTTSAQPDQLPFHKFRLDDVVCIEPLSALGPLGTTSVISAGGTFRLRVDLGFDGLLDGMMIGKTFEVVHHWQRIEDGAVGELPIAPLQVVVPPGQTLAHMTVESGPYSTAVAPAAGDLQVPAGFAAGTFRITTHIHFTDPAISKFVAAFDDGLILMVVS